MLNSKNNFFNQSDIILSEKRDLLISILEDRNLNSFQIKEFIDAYDAFWKLKDEFVFDGATIVADFDTIFDLDASAMVHDYKYLLLRNVGFLEYLNKKIKADIEFANNMRSLGVTWLNAWFRASTLLIVTPLWMVFVSIRKI